MHGILLVNLGTPAAPTPEAVRSYLAEFLSDPRVVKLPRVIWLPILHGIVLRTRPAKSAAKYAAIWTAEGSPLAVHTARQAKLLAHKTGKQVEYAMRYGQPSVSASIQKLKGEYVVVPLYPQYAESTTASVADAIPAGVPMVQHFHDHPAYITALAACVRRHWEASGRGLLLFSFHGLPKRGGERYESECRVSARLLAQELELKDAEWRITFQSRFGYADWLQPYTESTLRELAQAGVRRVDVFCPGFVSDCLETLEELGMAARKTYLESGGAQFHLIPCLNEAPEWIAALEQIAAA
jgi:ferrochelatase